MAPGADFSGTNLVGAECQDADFTGTDFRFSNLVGAVLEGALFKGANVSHADFSEAKLGGSSFVGAKGEGAKFTGQLHLKLVLAAGSFLELVEEEGRQGRGQAGGSSERHASPQLERQAADRDRSVASRPSRGEDETDEPEAPRQEGVALAGPEGEAAAARPGHSRPSRLRPPWGPRRASLRAFARGRRRARGFRRLAQGADVVPDRGVDDEDVAAARDLGGDELLGVELVRERRSRPAAAPSPSREGPPPSPPGPAVFRRTGARPIEASSFAGDEPAHLGPRKPVEEVLRDPALDLAAGRPPRPVELLGSGPERPALEDDPPHEPGVEREEPCPRGTPRAPCRGSPARGRRRP